LAKRCILYINGSKRPPFSRREVSAADLASELVSEGVEEPTMGEAAALLVLSNVS
jgi:hypothetical protein